MVVTVFGDTLKGTSSANNEDALIIEQIWDSDHWLLAVIDGLGSYPGGAVASGLSKRILQDYVSEHGGEDCLTLITEAVTKANNVVYQRRSQYKEYAKMGCVLTAVILDVTQKKLFVAHVGDTRLYRCCSDGRLVKLTHDHSFVGRMLDQGMITESQAKTHSRKNYVDRSLGEEFRNVDSPSFIESAVFPFDEESQYLLCTDGLSDMLMSEDISSVLLSTKNIPLKVKTLFYLAIKEGSDDDLTAVIFQATDRPMVFMPAKSGAVTTVMDEVEPFVPLLRCMANVPYYITLMSWLFGHKWVLVLAILVLIGLLILIFR